MEQITFENLPKAVTNLQETVNNIERLLLAKSHELQPTETDRWFDLNELCIYLPDKPAKPTVYGWVHAGLIPCHKGAKRLRFLKSDIDQWLKNGKQITLAEITGEAETYLMKKGGNNA